MSGERRRAGLRRNTLTTGVGALAGVLTGLLLDVTIAASFGAGRKTDAFFVAMRLPVGIAAVLMAGANQSLVPVFSRWRATETRRANDRLVSNTLIATVLAGSAVAVLGTLFAHPIMAVTAPGLPGYEITAAASLARILFWIVPLVAGAEVFRARLNAQGRFGIPAGMNVVMNGLAAAVIIIFAHGHIRVAAWAYFMGAAAQFGFMLVATMVAGFRPQPTLALRDPELTRVAKLSTRPLAAAGLNPLARVVEQLFVSFLPPGSITILNYANRLISAIGGTVLFRSVMVVLLPRLALAWEGDDREAVRYWTRSGVRLMLTISLPLTALMIVLGRPASLVVFHRGNFSHNDAATLGVVLAVYATSLVGQALQRSLLAPFYARLDMKPPFRNAIYGVLANLLLLPPLVLPAAHHERSAMIGVAIAFSLAQYVNVLHAWWHLGPLIGEDGRRSLMLPARPQLTRIIVATLGSTGVMVAGYALLQLGHPWGRWVLLARTTVVGAAGVITYGLLLDPSEIKVFAVKKLAPHRNADATEGAELSVISAGSDPGRESRQDLSWPHLMLSAAAAAVILGGLVGTLGLLRGAALTVGVAGGVGLVWLGIVRFEYFVMAALVIRSALDSLKLRGGSGGGSSSGNPAAALAVVFMVLAFLWFTANRSGAHNRNREERSLLWWPAVAFFVAGLASVLSSSNPSLSLVEAIRIGAAVTMLLVLERLMIDPKNVERVLVAVYASAVIPLLFATVQLLSGHGRRIGGFSRIQGTFDHPNPFAIYLTFLVVMGAGLFPHVRRQWRVPFAMLLAYSWIFLLLTYTRSAWISAIVGLLVVGFLQSRRLLVGVVVAGILALVAVPSVSARFSDLNRTQYSGQAGNSLAWRYDYWTELAPLVKQSPVTGIGLKVIQEDTIIGKNVHNDFLRALVETGLLGFVAYLALLLGLVRTAIRSVKATVGGLSRGVAVGFAGCTAAFILLSAVSNIISQNVLLWYFFAFAAAAAAVTRTAGQRRKAPVETIFPAQAPASVADSLAGRT